MGLLNLFKKKETRPSESLKNVLSEDARAQILNLAQATRHLEIMRDSMELLQKTVSPGTFFSRYRTAIKEAQVVLQLCNGHEIGNSAEKTLHDLTGNKVRYFNNFLDRCNSSDKLPFVKNEIEERRSEMPSESYSHFLDLLKCQVNRNDADKYIFCSVVFYEGGKSYYYLSNNPELQCGDYVTVPVGKNNEEKTGYIAKIEVYKGTDAPVPVDRLKHIIE